MNIFSKKNIIIFVILVIIVTFSLFFFSPKEVVYTEQEKIISTEHQDFIIATGNIGARDDIDLSFRRSGVVSKIFFEAGNEVKQGSIIAQLNIGSLLTELESQKLFLEQARIKLESFIEGPEDLARERIQAEKALSLQLLDNSIQKALSSVQKSAVLIENGVRTNFDVFFDGTIDNLRFISNANISDKASIINARKNIDIIFNRWRGWVTLEKLESSETILIVSQFIKDLYVIQTEITKLYDQTRSRRFISEENENIFLQILKMREIIQESISQNIDNRNSIHTANSEVRLKTATALESLSGGTVADKKNQEKQVEVEQEKLRLLNLQIEEAKIVAPFTGVVGQVLIEEGEYGTSGSLAIRFISKGGFEVFADVTEAEIQEIKTGEEIKARVDVLNKDITVRVRNINQTEKKDSEVPVYSIVFDVVDEDLLLRSGMTVDVFVPFGENKNILAVPQEAVFRFGTENTIIVLRKGNQFEIPVELGSITHEGLIGISGDIKEGDVVVFNVK